MDTAQYYVEFITDTAVVQVWCTYLPTGEKMLIGKISRQLDVDDVPEYIATDRNNTQCLPANRDIKILLTQFKQFAPMCMYSILECRRKERTEDSKSN